MSKKYKNGLVLGKFMPFHLGHEFLLQEAAKLCDSVLVLVCTTKFDSNRYTNRKFWISDWAHVNQLDDTIHVQEVDTTQLPQTSEVNAQTTEDWSTFLNTYLGRYIPCDVIVSSEQYGPPLAKALNKEHHMVDEARQTYPIRATEIRAYSNANWEYISNTAKFDLARIICINGPESTGKSSLAEKLSSWLGCPLVKEQARQILFNAPTGVEQFELIAAMQAGAMTYARTITKKGFVIADTDLRTTQIYLKKYLGLTSPVINRLELLTRPEYHIYLNNRGIPHVADHLRDFAQQPETMQKMFDESMDELVNSGHNITYVAGSNWNSRTKQAENWIGKNLLGEL